MFRPFHLRPPSGVAAARADQAQYERRHGSCDEGCWGYRVRTRPDRQASSQSPRWQQTQCAVPVPAREVQENLAVPCVSSSRFKAEAGRGPSSR